MTTTNNQLVPLDIVTIKNRIADQLTPEQIQKLGQMGYDLKFIYSLTLDEVRLLVAKVESFERTTKLLQERANEIAQDQLEVTTDLRDITADEVIRTNQWRNDEIVRQHKKPESNLLFMIGLFYLILNGVFGGIYLAIVTNPYATENGFVAFCKIFFPILNFISKG